MSPRAVVKSEIRDKLLASAKGIAARQGWGAVTVRKVADNVGYSQAVVYEYFGSKDGLMNALAQEGFQVFCGVLKTAYETSTTPISRLTAMAHAYWGMAVEHPELYQVMFGLEGANRKREFDIPEAQQAVTITQTAVSELIELSGSHSDSRMAFLQLWALLHGLVALDMAGILERKTDPRAALNYAIAGYIQSYIHDKRSL